MADPTQPEEASPDAVQPSTNTSGTPPPATDATPVSVAETLDPEIAHARELWGKAQLAPDSYFFQVDFSTACEAARGVLRKKNSSFSAEDVYSLLGITADDISAARIAAAKRGVERYWSLVKVASSLTNFEKLLAQMKDEAKVAQSTIEQILGIDEATIGRARQNAVKRDRAITGD